MKRDNYTCVGQLSLFDYFKSEEEEILLYDLLPVGTKVWRVVKADILEYEIIDECWQIGDNVIYRLQKDSGFWTLPSDRIGTEFFLARSEAENIVSKYKGTYIRAENIIPVEQKCFAYIRPCDGRQMKSFYAILPDGKVYIKEFYTYEHMKDYGNIDKARKQMLKFVEKQRDFEYNNVEEIEQDVIFKNMYLCGENDTWDYAEACYKC